MRYNDNKMHNEQPVEGEQGEWQVGHKTSTAEFDSRKVIFFGFSCKAIFVPDVQKLN